MTDDKALREALEERNRLWEELQRKNAVEADLEYWRARAERHRAVALVAGSAAASARKALIANPADTLEELAYGIETGAAAASVPAVPGPVTVAIPVLNGARYLDEVLDAVRAQRVDREVELAGRRLGLDRRLARDRRAPRRARAPRSTSASSRTAARATG